MIIVFKLVSAETIISKVVYEDDNFYLIKMPLVVEEIYDRKNNVKMVTESKWCSLSDESIMLLSKSGVVAFCIASKDQIKIYLQASEFYSKQLTEEESEQIEDADEMDDVDSFVMDTNPLKSTIH